MELNAFPTKSVIDMQSVSLLATSWLFLVGIVGLHNLIVASASDDINYDTMVNQHWEVGSVALCDSGSCHLTQPFLCRRCGLRRSTRRASGEPMLPDLQMCMLSNTVGIGIGLRNLT